MIKIFDPITRSLIDALAIKVNAAANGVRVFTERQYTNGDEGIYLIIHYVNETVMARMNMYNKMLVERQYTIAALLYNVVEGTEVIKESGFMDIFLNQINKLVFNFQGKSYTIQIEEKEGRSSSYPSTMLLHFAPLVIEKTDIDFDAEDIVLAKYLKIITETEDGDKAIEEVKYGSQEENG